MSNDPASPSSPRQRLHLILLGVEDVARSAHFYTSLGWAKAAMSHDGFAVFDLGEFALALISRRDLASDALQPTSVGTGFTGTGLVYLPEAEEQVGSILAKAVECGGTMVKPATVTPYGVAGYFKDPDGLLFEVDWEPTWTFDEDHRLILSDAPAATP